MSSVCYYCGCAADSIDHVPPIVARIALADKGLKLDLKTVDACRECNSALHHRSLWTLSARKSFIKKWLKRRYRKYLSIPDWSDQELAQLGPGLQKFVTDGAVRAEIIRARISW